MEFKSKLADKTLSTGKLVNIQECLILKTGQNIILE